MKYLGLLFLAVITLAACQSRKNFYYETDMVHRPVYSAPQQTLQQEKGESVAQMMEPVVQNTNNGLTETHAEAPILLQQETFAVEEPAVAEQTEIVKKKVQITSFKDIKALASTGSISLSKKQMRQLDKLEAKLGDDFFNTAQAANNSSNAVEWEWTTLTFVVAGVAVLGLLLALFAGWFFGLFLAILGGAALVLKLLGVIDF